MYGRKVGSLTGEESEKLKKGYVGRQYKLLVYEQGMFEGIPKGVPEPWQDVGFGFRTHLVILKVLEAEKP